MENYLAQIDQYIDIINEDKNEYLKGLSILIQKYFQIQDIVADEDFLFKKQNEMKIQRFISICFLRLISNENYVNIEQSKHLVLKCMQNSINDIWNIINITDKTATFEKEIKIRDFGAEREKDIYNNLRFTGEISDLKTFQQNFRRTINNKKNIVLQLFCIPILEKSMIDKVFNRITDFLESEENNKYNNFKQFEETLNIYLDNISACNTRYAKDLFLYSFLRIKKLLLKEMEKSPYFLPADIELHKTEKKYPFAKGHNNSISIIVANKGKGFANNVSLNIVDFVPSGVEFIDKGKYIGNLKIESIIVDFEYKVIEEFNRLEIEIKVAWTDSEENCCSKIEKIVFNGQASDLNWEEIAKLKPYNLEPVETNKDLIGRDTILQTLQNTVSMPLGSAYIYGQRRVGKTSIVKTLQNSISCNNILVYYIEAGDWNDAKDAYKSMENLGVKICRKIKKINVKFSSVQIPDFAGSFNQISNFLDDITDIDKEFRLLIILDEFDRISNSLYERGEIGRSFVLTIRAISNRPQFGFILVGGEKMEYILSQWQEFNKFSPIRVDYFSKERDWEDFNKLIKKPVENILEISDGAIVKIYEETAGNPYFTKKICMELYSNMIRNRDVHVTDKEVFIASEAARSSSNIGATDFSHFWEDGIKGKVEKEEEVSLKRRKLLIIMAQVIQNNQPLNIVNIKDAGTEIGLTENDIDKFLLEFEQRKILSLNKSQLYFVVNFFKDWLVSEGKEKIIATFEEEERVVLNQKLEEEARVKTEDIGNVLKNLKSYKGNIITISDIRKWLDQFDDVFDQRLMFKLLENFKLYNELEIREKLSNLFTMIRRDLNRKGNIRILDPKKKKRDDMLVTYLDKSPAKGATYFAKIFADENNVYAENVCSPEFIEKRIVEKSTINCIVIIDDIIGSGNTIITNMKEYFDNSLLEIIKERNIPIYISVITGFLSSKEKIEAELSLFIESDFDIFIVDVLDFQDKCFSLQAQIFANPSEAKKAKEICMQKGEKLEAKMPLGYSNCELLVAFPMNCPNNTLPIFWKRIDGWIPLFERKQ